MSKARNMADLLDSNGDVVTGALDNVPPSNDASALTTGTLDSGRLPSSGVSASSLTTGTLPVDRVPYLGRRNLIINGAMQVWQRGTSFSSGHNTAPFRADRFWNYSGTATGSIERSTDVPSGEGFVYSFYNNTDSSVSFGTNIELSASGNPAPFHIGQTITMSFWVKSPTAGSSNMACQWRDSHANGSNSVYATGSQSYNWTTSWSRQVIQFTLTNSPNATNKVLDFETGLPSGAKITGVQCEFGSVATPFEHRSYGEELALCQRYCYAPTSGAMGNTAQNGMMLVTYNFPVTMRANASLIATGQTFTYTVPWIAGGATGSVHGGEMPGNTSYMVNYSNLSRNENEGDPVAVNISAVRFEAEL